jgi:hypothetical protein
MKRFALSMAVFAATVLVGTAWAGEDKPEAQVRLELDLVDGSHIIGVPSIDSVPVQTSYAKMDIPLKQLISIKMGDDHETASVDLRNGDKLKGVISIGPIKLATVFGKIAIGIEHIRQIDVVPGGGAGQKGLVLWNRLGSESEVKHSRVGLAGTLNGGRFVPGRFGNGIELNMNEQYGVTFPVETVSGPDGCVEFWAKLVDFPNDLAWGARPALLSGDDGKGAQHFIMLHINGNDGQSNGGLIADIPGLANGATGQYGQWTYARAIGSDSAGDWHHYAMVWASVGIPGVDNGERTVAAYVDGKLNSGVWRGRGGNSRPPVPASGRFGLLFHQGMQGGRVVYDNLKVWKYPKTDFSDRTDE